MKMKCSKCGFVIDVPEHEKICCICFSEHLGKLNDLDDSETRFERLTVFINELCEFGYQRGLHNAKCKNSIELDGWSGFNWEEIDFEEELNDLETCEEINQSIILIKKIKGLTSMDDDDDIIKVLDLIHPATSNLDAFFSMKLFLGLSFVSSDSFTNMRNSINTFITGRVGHYKSSIILAFAKILEPEMGIYSYRIYSQLTMTHLLSEFNKKLLIIDNAQALSHPATDIFKFLEAGVIALNMDGRLLNGECKGSVACIGNRNLADTNMLQRFDILYEIPALAKEDSYKISGQLSSKLSEKDSNIIREYLIKAKELYPKVDLDKAVMAKLDLFGLSLRDRNKTIKLIKGIAALRFRTYAKIEDFELIQNILKTKEVKK